MQSMASTRPTLRRKELADAARVNPETLRFYESAGLIPRPARSPNGYRRYAPDTVRRIAFIQQAKALGFTLREIREMLALRAKIGVSCRQSTDVAERKIAELDAKIASLRDVRRTLAMFLRRCRQSEGGKSCEMWALLDA